MARCWWVDGRMRAGVISRLARSADRGLQGRRGTRGLSPGLAGLVSRIPMGLAWVVVAMCSWRAVDESRTGVVAAGLPSGSVRAVKPLENATCASSPPTRRG